MKKLLTILLSVLLLSACSNNVFSLEDKYYFNEDLIEIESLDEVEELVNNKESFALFVYMPGCTSCAAFKPVLNTFLKQNEMTFYQISTSVIGSDKDNSIMESIEYAPSVLLYNHGKVIAYLDAMKDEDLKYYKTSQAFTKWFTDYCEIKIQ